MEQALIYTSKGNLPVYDLVRSVEWIFDPSYIKVVEKYTYNGEVVKEGADVYALPIGTNFKIEQGNING